MEAQEIIDAITNNPELISGVMPTIIGTEMGKKVINTEAETIANEKIAEKVKSIHQQYDDDMAEILGERPDRSDDGTKEKTYQKVKSLYSELKDLRGQKESLSKDTKVAELEAKIEELSNGDGASKQIKDQFETAKKSWLAEKAELTTKLESQKGEQQKFQKSMLIDKELNNIKFDPNVTPSIQKMVINDARNQLVQNSELRDGKLVFLDADGKVELNKSTYDPIDVHGKLTSLESIRDISLKDEHKGGNAKTTVPTIQTTTVEGKDAKKLNLPTGSFKSKAEFVQVSEKAMLDAGITRRDPEWRKLQDEAYKEHDVSKLPAES